MPMPSVVRIAVRAILYIVGLGGNSFATQRPARYSPVLEAAMCLLDKTYELLCLSKSGMLLLASLFVISQARAQLAPPRPPAKTSIIVSDGRSLDGWRTPTGDWKLARIAKLSPDNPKALALTAGTGLLVNGNKGRTGNLLSKYEHGDVMAAIEYMVPQGSNSGIYFQGRYEIQILDSYGKEKVTFGDNGGVYERWANGKGFGGASPIRNVSKLPGDWQKFIITFRAPRFDKTGKKIENARFVKVVHNGQLIHHNVEVTGPTRSAAFNDEKPTGPLMLQGDHGPVAFQKIVLKPVKLD